MLQTGQVLGVTTEEVTTEQRQFLSRRIHVLDGLRSVEVTVGRAFPLSELPDEGDMVALEVVVSTYQYRNGSAGLQVTAVGRNREVEEYLQHAVLPA